MCNINDGILQSEIRMESPEPFVNIQYII